MVIPKRKETEEIIIVIMTNNFPKLMTLTRINTKMFRHSISYSDYTKINRKSQKCPKRGKILPIKKQR